MQNPSTSEARWRRAALSITSCLLIALAGCGEQQPSVAESTNEVVSTMDWEMQWAQAALERNPDLEIIAVDRQAREFTVRDRRSARVAEFQLAQIAAVPVELLAASATPAASAPAEEPTEPEAPAAIDPAASMAANEATDRSAGRTKVSGAGISVIYGEGEQRERSTAPLTDPNTPYTVDRSGGVVRISGPGVSIEASGQPAAMNADPALASADVEPVICEGPRVMQLNSRTIRVDGDALTARGGCELYITNSTIVASGTGVVINDATVHINNSRIQGGEASFEAKEQAKVFLRGSTLSGLSRRNQNALIQDQGGNRYQ